MRSGPPAVEVRDLGVDLGTERVLSGVTFRIDPGEFVGIAGPNGGGKSTLLRAMLGLTRISQGEVRLFGQPLRDFRAHARVGYLAQNASHVEHGFPATAREVVAMGLTATRRWPWQRAKGGRAAVDEAMAATDVLDLARKRVGEMSGGQRQRVLLSRALVARPELLVLDEPTTGVDPHARDAFAHLLQEINRSRGTTIVLVSHDDDMLHHAAQRLLVIDRGLISDSASQPIKSSLEHLHGGPA